MTILLLTMDQLYRSFWPKSLTKVAHPLDFAPCDFWLLQELKVILNSHRFSKTADIQEHMMDILNSIPQQRLQQHFEQWKHQLTNCTAATWNYLEGDKHYQCVSK
jgi:hypothetical protein